jgi:tetratricopeptide (TPR) repeat protein
MSSWNPFKKKSDEKEVVGEVDPAEFPEPTDYESFLHRGWMYHVRGEQEQAESDFRRAISYSPESIDANFALGLNLKYQGKKDEAVEVFTNTMQIIEEGEAERDSKTEMMRRFTLGHINELTTGEWNLEDQIWHRS